MTLESVFLKLVNMSLSASFLILAVMLVRLLFKKAPKWIFCLLWGCVALRLLIPFSIESSFSLLPSSDPLPAEILYTPEPMIESGIPQIDEFINPILSESMTPAPGASVNPTQVWSFILAAVWVIGMALLLLYALVSYLLVRRKVRESVPLQDNIRLCDKIPSPFILGMLRPMIYLPSSMNDADAAYVIAHENAHLARRDHLWKPFGFALLILHWFNPLVWVGYILLCRDIELACDEKVIGKMETAEKKQYSEVLLACSVHRRLIAACPLAFGEVGVKERIKNVLNYKKPAFWIIVLALIACVVTAVCFLTNPPTGVNERLAVFLDCQIAAHHQSEQTDDNFCALDYQVLGKRTRGDTVTVYMWVLYEEFSWDSEIDGGVKQESGAHTPTVITAKKVGDAYELVEYRTPRDGSYYADDIREMFPMRMWADAMDSEKFYKIQGPILAEMAYEYYKENVPLTDTGDSTDIADVGGADAPEEMVETRLLTLDDVIALAAKGDDLMWEDFAPFTYTDVGKELYIQGGLTIYDYKIKYKNDHSTGYFLHLLLGDTKTDGKPMYALLYCDFHTQSNLELRGADVNAFIEKHSPVSTYVTEHKFLDPPYYTQHISIRRPYDSNTESALEKLYGQEIDNALYYHEGYQDCSHCEYTRYFGWYPCRYGTTECRGGCDYYMPAWRLTMAMNTEYLETIVFPALLLSFESAENTENIRACIEENRAAYDTLLSYNDFTLRYIFKCFIAGGPTGLRGEILCELLKDFNPEHVLALDADNGQMYFSAWENSVKRIREQHGDAWMEENFPAGALLLRMLERQ